MTSAVRIRILLAALVAVFAVAAPAIADESSKEGYGGIGGDVLTDIGGKSAPSTKAKTTPSGGVESAPAPSGAVVAVTKTESDQLPFTGLDLGLLLGVGLLLLLSGVALRRLGGEGRSSA